MEGKGIGYEDDIFPISLKLVEKPLLRFDQMLKSGQSFQLCLSRMFAYLNF